MELTESPTFRRRANDGAVFSSSKCPCGPGLKHSCELPFGFLFTPMATDITTACQLPATDALPPVLCLTCLAYLNLYASFDAESGEWECPLCGGTNVAPKQIFATDSSSELAPIMMSPIVEYRQHVVAAGAAASDDDDDDLSCYIFVLDGNLPRDEAHGFATAVQVFLQKEIKKGKQFTIGLIVFRNAVSMYQLGLQGMASADVYTRGQADLEEEQDLMKRRLRMADQSYLIQVTCESDLNPLWQCLSAVYGLPLNPESVNPSSSASQAKAPLSRKEQLRLRKEERLRKQKQGSQNGHTPNDPPASPMESPWVRRKQHESQSIRCTGEALQCAVDMAEFGLSVAPPRTCRILVFTDGCPNTGKASVVKPPQQNLHDKTGAVNATVRATQPHIVDPYRLSKATRYFDNLARDAGECGIGIDVFCTGAESLGMPTYQALVEPSGGYALPHESFKTPHLAHNLDFCLTQTHISRTEDANSENQPATTMNQLDACVVDFRMSSFVSPTHVVGPGQVLYDEHGLLPNERSSFSLGACLAANRGFRTNNLPSSDMLAASLTRLRMGRYDPLSTLSTMLRVNESFQPGEKHAFFQCIVRYVEPNGKTIVTRVCTNRLPVARSVYDFLDDMDEEVVPVMLGKEAVYRAIVGREDPQDIEDIAFDTDRLEVLANEAQRDLDATIHRISGAFRLVGLQEGTRSKSGALAEEGGIAASPSSLDFAFPPELADALHRLFHLRRGALLNPGPLQSMDDRSETRSLFLRLSLDDCLCMMAPSLWGSTNDALLEPIPSDTLALWDTCVIAADQHDCLFVWSGRAALGPEYDAIRNQCVQFLQGRSRHRFPMPQLHILKEGESMCRRFTTRLAPSHADPPEQQLVHFPSLASLDPNELHALREKFRFYDTSLDASFRRWFWGVASASSYARNEGMSLCH